MKLLALFVLVATKFDHVEHVQYVEKRLLQIAWIEYKSTVFPSDFLAFDIDLKIKIVEQH